MTTKTERQYFVIRRRDVENIKKFFERQPKAESVTAWEGGGEICFKLFEGELKEASE